MFNWVSENWKLISSFLTFGSFCIAFYLKAKFATKEEVSNLDKRVSKIENRVAANEEKIEQMPSRDDLHKQEIMIERMSGKIDSMAVKMQGIEEISKRQEKVISRVEDYLLNKKE
ncbi:MAG: DUF2730 family protein [Alphaproteobacteria bacterium]